MFFIISVTGGRKDFDHHQTMICCRCGKYGNYSVYMTYMVLSLFFIPILKWNRKYFVTASCCKTTYQLDPELGRRIARGESVEIRPEDLTFVSGSGWGYINEAAKVIPVRKRCENCGFSTEEDYDFCPKCGKPLE